MDAHTRSFAEGEEGVVLQGLRSDVVSVGALGVARNVHQPGWRWSDDIRPAPSGQLVGHRHDDESEDLHRAAAALAVVEHLEEVTER
jgi:hypothetical protein